MWQNVEKVKGAKYSCKPLYILDISPANLNNKRSKSQLLRVRNVDLWRGDVTWVFLYFKKATVSLKGKLGLNMLNHWYVLSLKDIFKTYFGSLSQKQWEEILQMPWQEIRKTKQLYLDEALTVMVLFIKLWKLLESFSESCAEIFFGEAQL